MSLATHKPQTKSRTEVIQPAVVAEPVKHEIYDNNQTPLWSLDAFLTGSRWTVDLYPQRLRSNDTTKKLDPSSDPAYQSYDKIEDFELLVQTSISSSYQNKEGLMETTGSAVVPSFYRPNIDDYFITDSNLARRGLFRITNINRLSHERESAHVIEYTLEEELKADSPIFADLSRKVVNNFYFSRARLIENKNPILVKETYQLLRNMQFAFREMATTYFRDFMHPQTMSLQLPGQGMRIVDPYILNFITSIIPFDLVSELSRMKFVSLNNDPVYKKPVLWTTLLNRSLNDLYACDRCLGYINPRSQHTPYMASSGTFAGADVLVRPYGEDASLQSSSWQDPFEKDTLIMYPLESIKPTTNVRGELRDGTEMYFAELPEPLRAYMPVHADNGYVFAKSFYEEKPNSVLEVMVLDYLRGDAINLKQLSMLVSLYPKMVRMDQFYYGPILMLLLKEADRGSYA